MSEVTDFTYAPGDNLKKFNKAIQKACAEVPVTHFEASPVKGGGVKVTLWTDYTEADEEDVKDDPSGDINVGDTITDGVPCSAFLAITNVQTSDQKALTDERLDTLADICQASVVEDIDLYDEDYDWLTPPEHPEAAPMYLPVKFSYTLRVFQIEATPEGEEEKHQGGDTTQASPKKDTKGPKNDPKKGSRKKPTEKDTKTDPAEKK